MLVQFSVKNYRSFCEPVTLSLVAAPGLDGGRKLEENTFETGHHMRLVKSAAIYGANASGKSNLIKAITFARTMILRSFTDNQPEQELNVSPFRLRSDTTDQATEFSLIWLDGHERFRYQFSLDKFRIYQERLCRAAAPARQGLEAEEKELFHRDGLNIRFGAEFPEGRDLPLNGFKRENALFLSYAAQFAGRITNQVMKWIMWQIRPISGLDDNSLGAYTAKKLFDNEWTDEIINMTKYADLGIDGIRAEKQPNTASESSTDGSSDTTAQLPLKERFKLITTRKVFDPEGNPAGKADFRLFADESEGTRKFISFAAPLIDVLQNARVLIIDEFDARFHSILSRAVLEMFNSRENQKMAQLIFATHDTNLLDRRLMRRDQIWFTEKDKFGATDLYSLASFKIDESANLERDYIQGKFGAIPYVRTLVGFDKGKE